jgi:hypothetical protein
MNIHLENIKRAIGQYRDLSLEETLTFKKKWIKSFADKDSKIPMHKCPNCKDFHQGDPRGYDWHGISYGKDSERFQCKDFIESLSSIRISNKEEIVIYEEDCVSTAIAVNLPDLGKFLEKNKNSSYEDIYITPQDLSWSLVLTHEMGYVGPFFVKR